MDVELILLILFIFIKKIKLVVFIWLMDWMVLGLGFFDSGVLLILGRGMFRMVGLKLRVVFKFKI